MHKESKARISLLQTALKLRTLSSGSIIYEKCSNWFLPLLETQQTIPSWWQSCVPLPWCLHVICFFSKRITITFYSQCAHFSNREQLSISISSLCITYDFPVSLVTFQKTFKSYYLFLKLVKITNFEWFILKPREFMGGYKKFSLFKPHDMHAKKPLF